MKYIRTKDGRIIDLEGWLSFETICVNAETNEAKKDICYQRTWFEQHGNTFEYKTEYISHNSQVLNQADTIEELCDEFVSVYDKYHDHWNNLKECLQLCGDGGAEIYGAIWTDKGLIYVAKMNDKGELELL